MPAFILCLLLLSSSFAFAQSDFEAQLSETETRYICPMHSHIVKDHPGTCPICGMQLEARQALATESKANLVTIPTGIQQQMSVVTKVVKRGKLWKHIRTLGQLSVDETQISHVHPRVEGWIETLHVNSQGQEVQKGQLLFELYSPQLVVAQEDFLQTLELVSKQPASKHLLAQARLKLKLLGLAPKIVQQLESEKRSLYTVPFYAEQSGVVTHLNVRQGMYIDAKTEMIAIADLSNLWVIADVFESQFDWVQQGKSVEIHLPELGLQGIETSIDYIYPQLDVTTRSLKVRLKLENPLKRLKPGMMANVEIFAGPKQDILFIPEQALIQGRDKQRVVVKQNQQEFEVKQVETGMAANGLVEIIAGLDEGEQVVTSGQFLIDSEANLQASFDRLAPEVQTGHSAHQH